MNEEVIVVVIVVVIVAELIVDASRTRLENAPRNWAASSLTRAPDIFYDSPQTTLRRPLHPRAALPETFAETSSSLSPPCAIPEAQSSANA